MLVFVEHKDTHEAFLLLGTGLGTYRSEVYGKFGDSVKQGTQEMLAVCDKTGKIYWFLSEELTVVTVDGKKVKDHWL